MGVCFTRVPCPGPGTPVPSPSIPSTFPSRMRDTVPWPPYHPEGTRSPRAKR